MKIINFPFESFVKEQLKASKDISRHFVYLQPLLDAEKILPNGTLFSSRVHNSRHVSRVAYLVKAASSIYRWLYHEFRSPEDRRELESDFESHLFFYQLAALFHDTGREGDGNDTLLWEQDSAINFYHYLTTILEISSEQALIYAECILNKDVSNKPGEIYHKMSVRHGEIYFDDTTLVFEKPIGWILLHTADCIDVIRARKSFDFRFLDFYSIFVKNNRISEIHFLLTGLVREITSIITLTGNDRFTPNTEHVDFESFFYEKPEEAYQNFVAIMLEHSVLTRYCDERQLSFPYLSTLYRMAENNEPPEKLSQLFESDKHVVPDVSVRKDFSLGGLWAGYFEDFFKIMQQAKKSSLVPVNALRIIPGGYIPSEVGVILHDTSSLIPCDSGENFFTSFYKNLPKKRPDYFEYPMELDIAQIKGLYFQTDFNRRCTQWIRADIEKKLPSECFAGGYKLLLKTLHSFFKARFQVSLPIYYINLSTGALVSTPGISFDDVFQAIQQSIQALKDALRSEKIGVDALEEVDNFFKATLLLIENASLTLEEKNSLKETIRYNIVVKNKKITLVKPWNRDALKNIVENARLVNRFGLYLLTFHPATHFKREKYLPELLAKLPLEYQRFGPLDSEYTATRYLSKPESVVYRVFLREGLLVSSQDFTVFSTESDNEIVCMTINGELYSSPKKNGVQHSSFNQGGYLLFSGNWSVKSGGVEKINADSGHYEPSFVSLQNFVYLLYSLGCKLDDTKFFYSLRTMLDNPTGLNYYKKDRRETHLPVLLSTSPVVMSETDHLVTPAKLKLLASMPYWYYKIYHSARKNMTEITALPTVLEQESKPSVNKVELQISDSLTATGRNRAALFYHKKESPVRTEPAQTYDGSDADYILPQHPFK